MDDLTKLLHARPLIQSSLPGLRHSLEEALAEWNRASPVMHAAMRPSARAHAINNLIYHFAGQNLDDVVFGEEKFQYHMRYGDLSVMRVKLLDSGMRAKNYPTRQSRGWPARIPLPGFPMARLNLGYRLDATASMLEDAFITLPTTNPHIPNEWVWQIYGPSLEPFDLRRNLFGEEVFRYEVA
ncbi:MAG: hypothetical protein Q7T33_12915 [Dehalococcoidia bacterium]|nr:hypothetical protein [Dehalococcoidia bacterium]